MFVCVSLNLVTYVFFIQLFTLYVNDLPFHLEPNSSLMYADDTSLKSSGYTINEVQNKLQHLTDETVS